MSLVNVYQFLRLNHVLFEHPVPYFKDQVAARNYNNERI